MLSQPGVYRTNPGGYMWCAKAGSDLLMRELAGERVIRLSSTTLRDSLEYRYEKRRSKLARRGFGYAQENELIAQLRRAKT